MMLKLKKGTVIFRNPQIFAVDAKLVVLERVLTKLFMLIYTDGVSLTLKVKKEHDVKTLTEYVELLEKNGLVSDAVKNIDAVEDWLRSNLLEMVFRGNVIKEKVCSLKPMHLLCFRIQNLKYCRDYNTSDQLFLMLRRCPEVLAGLKQYLCKGWDVNSNNLVKSADLDVDTAGILYLVKELKETKTLNTKDTPEPLLKKQSDLFNDDIRRLLVYQEKLPRSVFIEYFKILCGFHLALYTMKLVYLLPQMVDQGQIDVEDDWSMIIDVTDNLNSKISKYAKEDFEKNENNYRRYIRATYSIDVVQNWLSRNNTKVTIAQVLQKIKDGVSEEYFNIRLQDVLSDLPDVSEKEFDKKDYEEQFKYFKDSSSFQKFVYLLESSNLGFSQYKYLRQFIDAATMKNSPSKLLADGRSRKYPRRGALGSKLLETLVQILVLETVDGGKYQSKSLSIDELARLIRSRYGLIINGIGDSRFKNADVETCSAFKENMEAFKNKLRQIGFYTDLSDACLLQKIRPRYNFN